MKTIFTTVFLLTFIAFNSFSQDRYWIGGTGNWTDSTHWATVSGGAGPASVPTDTTNVFIDAASGLVLNDTIYLDSIVLGQNFDFSTVGDSIYFSSTLPLIEVFGDINASGTAKFDWLGGTFSMLDTAELSIQSNGQEWNMNYIFQAVVDTVTLNDDFNCLANITSIAEKFKANGIQINAQDIDIQGTAVVEWTDVNAVLTGSTWTSSATSSIVHTGTISTSVLSPYTFDAGNITNSFDTLTVSDVITFPNGGMFSFIEFDGDSLTLGNGQSLVVDSLVATNGSCGNKARIRTSTLGGAASTISRKSAGNFASSNLEIEDINAVPITTELYTLSSSDTINASGWSIVGKTFYWIDNTGNWSDQNHWSETSGGLPSACFPGASDTVIFDLNSFATAGDTVRVDDRYSYGAMYWTADVQDAILSVDSLLTAYGDTELDDNLQVTRSNRNSSIQFVQMADLTTEGAFTDVILVVYMNDQDDSLKLMDDLVMTDSTAIILVRGNVITNSNLVQTGSVQVFEEQFPQNKHINLGNSTVHLAAGFNSENTSLFTLDAGNSHVFIDTSRYQKYLSTDGETFYDVTLGMNYVKDSIINTDNIITGSNNYNDLTILPSSEIVIDSTVTQTIVGTLLMKGNCKDSIYIKSSNPAIPSILSQTNNVVGECLELEGITGTGLGGTYEARFSTDAGNNTGWIFNTNPATVADLTLSGSECYGDTVTLTNNSTAFSGNFGDLTFEWYLPQPIDSTIAIDTIVTYFIDTVPDPPQLDSTVVIDTTITINYGLQTHPDTTKFVFPNAGVNYVALTSEYTNFCMDSILDSIYIKLPQINYVSNALNNTICAGDSLAFEIGSATQEDTLNTSSFVYETFLNGVSDLGPGAGDTLYYSSSFNDGDSISFRVFEDGCPDTTNLYAIVNVNALPNITFNSNDLDTTICATDEVIFSASGGDNFRFFSNGNALTGLIHDTLGGDSLTINTLMDQDTITVLVEIDSTGCQDTKDIIFTVHPLPATSLTSSVLGNVICDQDEVTFTASGADSYQFFVNSTAQGPISGTNTFVTSSLAFSDTVSVVGYTSNGCILKAPSTFTYTVNPLPNVMMTLDDVDTSICSGTDVNFTASGASLYEFFVNGTSQGAASANNELSLSTLSDNDEVHVIGEFSGCSTSSDTATFEVFISPTTTLLSDDANDTICLGTQVNFTTSGADLYEWFVNGNSQGPASAGATTFSSSSLANGNIVTITGTSNGCEVSQSIQYTVNPVPEVSLFSNDNDNKLCDGDAITFTTANAANFEWFINDVSQGAPNPSITFSPTLPVGNNVISVVGTNTFNCTDTIDTPISIDVYAIPSVTLASSDADDIICSNTEVTFTASGSDLFQFFIDGNSIGSLSSTSSFTTTSLLDGQNITAWGSSNGCISPLTAPITMTVNTIPSVSLTGTDVDNVFCEGETNSFTANTATNYEFFVDNVSQGASSPVNTLDVSGYASGNYNIEVVGIQAGCSDTAEVSLLINPTPTLTLTSSDADNIICQDEEITISVNGANLYEFFVDGGSQGPTSILNSFTSTMNDGEVISVTGTTSLGCSNTSVYGAISVTPLPTVSLTSSDLNDSICVSELVTFTGSGATEYEFFIDGASLGASSIANSIAIDSLTSGESVTVIGTQNNCQNTSAPITFSVFSYPVIDLTNNGEVEICDGEATDLIASGGDNYVFLIDNVPTGISGPGNTFNSPVTNGSTLSVQGETNGCSTTASQTYTFVVNSYPTISVSSSDSDNEICLDENVTLTSSGAQTYQVLWNGLEVQNGVSSTYSNNEIQDGDIVSIIGFNGDCPSVQSDFNFVVNSMTLGLTASPSNMICEGEPVTFTGTGADQYEFLINGNSVQGMSASNTYASSTLSNLDSVQMIAQSSATGCTQAWDNYILMNVLDEPIITEVGQTTFCEGDSVLLISSSEFGNQWLLDGNPIVGATNDSLYISQSGNYSLENTSGAAYSIWSKGYNANGVVGNGNNFNLTSPEPANTDETFTQLSSGSNFIIGLTDNNTVYTWGDNGSGQLGNGTFTAENEPLEVSTLSNIRSVATTGESSAAVDASGQVFVWGNNNDGQLGLGSGAIVNFPTQNNLLSNIDTIVGGLNHFVFLNSNGEVFTSGNNNFGQLGDGTTTDSNAPVQVTLPGIQYIGASEYSTFAVDSSGNLYAWGNNNNGQLGLGDLVNRLTPDLSSLKNVNQADGGAEHSVFKTATNEVYVSGGNTYGQLGTGNTSAVQVPTKIDVQGVSQISASQYNSYFLRTDKTVSGVGYNVENQINATAQVSITSVVQMEEYDGVSFIEGGILSSHVISDEAKSCESSVVNTTMETVAQSTITENDGVLTASAGTSYQWYLDGLPIPNENSATIPLTAGGNYSVEVTYANGCSSLSESYFYSAVGIDKVVTFNVSIYPNPTEGILNIQIGELQNVDIKLIDATGRIVRSTELTEKNNQLDMSDLSPGVYSLILNHNGQRITKRISKM